MSATIGEIKPSTANTIWIATALLHRENKDRSAFKAKEIFQRVKDLGLLSVSDETILMHISSHCVANSSANPDNHRKLFRVDKALYRLYRKGDAYHWSRKDGKITPVSESIPQAYRELLDWYEKEYCDKPSETFQESTIQDITPYTARLRKGSIEIPLIVQERLKLEEGDHLAFIENTANTMIVKKARVKLLV